MTMVTNQSDLIPLYRGKLAILICDEVIEVAEYYDDLGDRFKINYAHMFKVNEVRGGKSYRTFLIGLNTNNPYSKLTYGTIGHECFHATSNIALHAGIYLTEESEEAYAYLFDWVISRVMEAVKAHGLELSYEEPV